jgi:hypothetical protein
MTVIYYLPHHHIGNPWLAISHANNHGYDQYNCTHIHTAIPLWPGYKWDQLNSRNSGDISISISISTWVLIKIKVSGASYNHRSIANQPGSQRCQSQYLETWREPGLPRTSRGFHRQFLKIELIWVKLWTCCSDSSLLLAITIEHSV